LLLATDSEGNTAWHLAADAWFSGDNLQKIWDFAKVSLTTEEIKNKFLLTTNSEGNTALHLKAKMGNTDNLQKIWDFGKENLTREEINITSY
jgi:ankyrin repeat protein